MIRYTLKCENDHGFESWFQSSDAFDKLLGSGLVSCPECGGTRVEKTLMAPPVPAKGREKSEAPGLRSADTDGKSELEQLREKIEAESDYVGLKFASEARAMHEGAIPHRAIYGEAKTEDAKKLIEEGVPVAPLPFTPKAKQN